MSKTKETPYSSEKGWITSAPKYGASVGRTSAHAAERLVYMVNQVAPITAGSKVLDVGSGAGAVALCAATLGGSVTATDLHQQMLDSIEVSEGMKLEKQVADARSLSKTFEEHNFSHAFSTFMLQIVTNPMQVLEEMHLILDKSSGVIGIGVWGLVNDPFVIWEKACRTIDPSYERPTSFDDENAWQTRQQLGDALSAAGFKDVITEDVTMPFPFDKTDAFVKFWFEAKNPAAERAMSNWSGSQEQARAAVAKVCKEQYDDGKAICTQAVLGVGKV